MKNEKLEGYGYALSAWRKWKKTMPEVQRREVDCPSTTDKPTRVCDADIDKKVQNEQMFLSRVLQGGGW